MFRVIFGAGVELTKDAMIIEQDFCCTIARSALHFPQPEQCATMLFESGQEHEVANRKV